MTRPAMQQAPAFSSSIDQLSHDPARYRLPSCPTLLVDDRFSILDSDDDEMLVRFWKILTILLSSAETIKQAKSLVDLLETISVILHGSSLSDYGFLRSFLDQEIVPDFWTTTWPFMKSLALRMPVLFPEHSLPILSPSQPRVILSREQVACLVIHQFLCTLPRRTWDDDVGYQDFHIWYDSYQPHEGAVKAYLTALFAYFNRLARSNETSPLNYNIAEWPISYELTTDHEGLDASADLRSLDVHRLSLPSTSPSVLGLPDGAAVISANKFIGFGRTGTQEETHVGGSPEVCPAVLVTPPLTDDQVMIVTGAEAMISIEGYGRGAHCGEILVPSLETSKHKNTWSKRTMLFMDALELDLADRDLGIPVDLQAGNVFRDLKKAYIGFKHKRLASSQNEPPRIFTGFWGCRTFGGNAEIKACIQWVAASLAGCDLTFICSDQTQHLFADKLEEFIYNIQKTGVTCKQFREVLLNLTPDDVGPEQSPLVVILDLLRRETVWQAS